MGLNNQDSTQSIYSDNGIRTQYGIILPPGARVAAYVRSTGIQSGDDGYLAANLCTTLAQGLARARSGLGDFVVCLPGHVESVADGTTFSAALVAGTKILGIGKGSNTPTFTWTATAGQWNVGVADVFIGGLRLDFSGINAVVNAINVNAADFGFSFNEVIVSSTAKAPTACMTLTVNAARADISGNRFRGLAASVPTSTILVSGAAPDVTIVGNLFVCPATAATGHINVTAAALGLSITDNRMYNTAAASTVCIAVGAVAADGIVGNNFFGVLTNGVADAQGITFGVGSLLKAFQNFCSDEPQKSGKLSPPVVAT